MKELDVVVGMENKWLRNLHKKKKFGFAGVIRGASDSDVRHAINETVEKHGLDVEFCVRGGLIGYCVRRVAEHVIDAGAYAKINIMYCAIETKDDVANAPDELLEKRLRELRWKMEPKYFNHSRLSIVQYEEKGWD